MRSSPVVQYVHLQFNNLVFDNKGKNEIQEMKYDDTIKKCRTQYKSKRILKLLNFCNSVKKLIANFF